MTPKLYLQWVLNIPVFMSLSRSLRKGVISSSPVTSFGSSKDEGWLNEPGRSWEKLWWSLYLYNWRLYYNAYMGKADLYLGDFKKLSRHKVLCDALVIRLFSLICSTFHKMRFTGTAISMTLLKCQDLSTGSLLKLLQLFRLNELSIKSANK